MQFEDNSISHSFTPRQRLGLTGAQAAAEAEEAKEIRAIAQYLGDTSLDHAFNKLVYGVSANVDDEGAILKNIKGTIFWKSQLDKYIDDTEKLLGMYRQSLEEKRNFLTFALTMVTIILSPLVCMTGYWYLCYVELHIRFF
jgi:hypothetical protein